MTRALSGSFSADLVDDVLTICRCWEITKTDGTVVRLTDHDKNLTFLGSTFISDGGFTISTLESGQNLSVDNSEMTVLLKSDAISQADILNGRFDGASVKVWLVNFENTSNYCSLPGAYLTKLKSADADKGTFELASLATKLEQAIGKVVIPTCDADLGDSRCGVDTSAYTVGGSVTNVATNAQFTDSSRSEADDYFTYGEITFVTGNNAGLTFEVLAYKSGTFTLTGITPYSISVGDTFTVFPGCDRTGATCKAKFNNYVRFKGFPFNRDNLTLIGGPL